MTGKEYHQLLKLSYDLDKDADVCARDGGNSSDPDKKAHLISKATGIRHSAERIRDTLKAMNS